MAAAERKSDVKDALEQCKLNPHVLKHFLNGVMRLHSDGGGKYANVSVSEFTMTTLRTPEHNPFAERINRTILDPICVLLEQAGLSAHYWDWALWFVVYVKNRLPPLVTGVTGLCVVTVNDESDC